MKKILSLILVAVVLGASFVSCNKKGESKANLETTPLTDSMATAMGELVGNLVAMQRQQDSAFDEKAFMEGFNRVLKGDTSMYSMGGMQLAMQVLGQATQLEQQGVKFDFSKFQAAFSKAVSSKDSVNQGKMQELQMAFQSAAQRSVESVMKKKAEGNKKKGTEYINKMAKQGYTKTASGMLYKVLAPGNGANFTGEKDVMVKYVGKHIDGKEFDNSHGEAVPFNVKQVVPGFAEMLKLMKPGMKVEVIMPSNLGYGDQGNQVIEPGETLVFVMETVGEKADEPAAPKASITPAGKGGLDKPVKPAKPAK